MLILSLSWRNSYSNVSPSKEGARRFPKIRCGLINTRRIERYVLNVILFPYHVCTFWYIHGLSQWSNFVNRNSWSLSWTYFKVLKNTSSNFSSSLFNLFWVLLTRLFCFLLIIFAKLGFKIQMFVCLCCPNNNSAVEQFILCMPREVFEVFDLLLYVSSFILFNTFLRLWTVHSA